MESPKSSTPTNFRDDSVSFSPLEEDLRIYETEDVIKGMKPDERRSRRDMIREMKKTFDWYYAELPYAYPELFPGQQTDPSRIYPSVEIDFERARREAEARKLTKEGACAKSEIEEVASDQCPAVVPLPPVEENMNETAALAVIPQQIKDEVSLTANQGSDDSQRNFSLGNDPMGFKLALKTIYTVAIILVAVFLMIFAFKFMILNGDSISGLSFESAPEVWDYFLSYKMEISDVVKLFLENVDYDFMASRVKFLSSHASKSIKIRFSNWKVLERATSSVSTVLASFLDESGDLDTEYLLLYFCVLAVLVMVTSAVLKLFKSYSSTDSTAVEAKQMYQAILDRLPEPGQVPARAAVGSHGSLVPDEGMPAGQGIVTAGVGSSLAEEFSVVEGNTLSRGQEKITVEVLRITHERKPLEQAASQEVATEEKLMPSPARELDFSAEEVVAVKERATTEDDLAACSLEGTTVASVVFQEKTTTRTICLQEAAPAEIAAESFQEKASVQERISSDNLLLSEVVSQEEPVEVQEKPTLQANPVGLDQEKTAVRVSTVTETEKVSVKTTSCAEFDFKTPVKGNADKAALQDSTNSEKGKADHFGSVTELKPVNKRGKKDILLTPVRRSVRLKEKESAGKLR